MKGSRLTSFLVICAMLLALLAPAALAQTGSAVVNGTVSDATHAVIPHAKVTLTNLDTNVVKSAETSDVGSYYFGANSPGRYSIAIELTGFKKFAGTLTLAVGQTAVVDAIMQIGASETVIEVTGAAPVITTEGAQVSDVKDALRIHELPLNGRQITTLFSLTPGVEGGANPRANGMKVGSVEMLLDGISLVDRFGGGMATVQPGLDTVQEFRIETAGSSAEYSRPATVSLASKSGTNEIHGSLFETHRNNFGGLRARQRQDSNAKPPEYIRNEYGASAGGAIVKNKTFWFGSWEGQKQRQNVYAEAQVPSEAIWNGDFSTAVDMYNNNHAITIYDPLSTQADGTRSPFAGNKITSDRTSPITATMKSVTPLPTNAAADPWTTYNFQTYYPNQTNYNTYTGKIDQVFSEKDTLSGRFTHSNSTTTTFGNVGGFPKPGSTNTGGTRFADSGLNSVFARWTHLATPNLLNEFQASVNRSPSHQGTLADSTRWAQKLGMPDPFSATGWPSIFTGNNSPFLYYGGWDAINPKDQNLTKYQIEDNVTWNKGKHAMKFGIRASKELNNVREMQQAQGSHTFYGDWTALYDPQAQQLASFTGSGFASMELGLPEYLSNQYNRGYFYFRQMEFGPYFTDTWRATQKLTVTMGLRWDKWTVYKEKFDRLVNLNTATAATGMQVITPNNTTMESIPGVPPAVLESWATRGLTWTTANQAGFPSGLLPADNNNFAPRLGMAYRINDKTVLRAGYGTYYWTMPLSQLLQSARTNPPLNLRFVNNIQSLNGTDYVYPMHSVPSANDYIGKAVVDITGNQAAQLNGAQAMMPWDSTTWSDNKAQEWTFTLEREIMKDTALRLSYIGNHGSDLEQRWSWNNPESQYNYQANTGLMAPSNPTLRQVNPNWAGGASANAMVRHDGFSNTNSLQAQVERRFNAGLMFQASYTFAHAMTTSDAGGRSSGSGSINTSSGGAAYVVPTSNLIMGEPTLSDNQLLHLGYANSTEVPAQHLQWNGIYDLPFGKGKKFASNASGVANLLVGGWQLAFNGDVRGGYWMGVNASKYLFGDPTLSADQQLTMNIWGRERKLWFKGYFDPTQATGVDLARLEQLVPVDPSQRVLRPLGSALDNRIPQTLADGTVRSTTVTDMLNWNARNFFRGPGAWNQDMSLFKTIPIKERFKLRLTADFFNAFNHPNNMAPDSTSGLQDLSVQSNEPRIIQFSARLQW